MSRRTAFSRRAASAACVKATARLTAHYARGRQGNGGVHTPVRWRDAESVSDWELADIGALTTRRTRSPLHRSRRAARLPSLVAVRPLHRLLLPRRTPWRLMVGMRPLWRERLPRTTSFLRQLPRWLQLHRCSSCGNVHCALDARSLLSSHALPIFRRRKTHFMGR